MELVLIGGPPAAGKTTAASASTSSSGASSSCSSRRWRGRRAPGHPPSVAHCSARSTKRSWSSLRDFYARPWADGDADEVRRLFVCECGDPGCEQEVETTVGRAADGPVLADGCNPARA